MIRYQNFLSSGNQFTEIVLNNAPLTVIIGKNGAGKSTILDALSFVLFNRVFRDINKNQIVNSKIRKNCLVETEFTIGQDYFLIRSGIKPSVFEVIKNGTLVNQTNTEDYQPYLEKQILRCNHKAFCQVVVLGKANYTPFMDLRTPERRAIVENLLDLEIFTTMNVILKKKNTENELAIRELQAQITILEERIKVQEENNARILKDKESRLTDLNFRLENYRIEYAEKKKNIKDLLSNTELNQSIDLIKEELNKFKQAILTLEQEINNLKEEIEFYKHNLSCPTCNQEINEKFKQNKLEEKEKLLFQDLQSIEILNNKIIEKRLELDVLNIKEKEFRENQINRDRQIAELESIVKNATFIKEQISDINSENLKFNNEYDAQLTDFKDLYDSLNKDKEVMKTLLVLLKDDGIKAKIIKQYIELINTLINNYLAEMDFLCQFYLDEEFNETIKSAFRDEFSYNSFSEGEKARINLAILFTWYEVAKRRNSIDTNIMFFDEVLDGSLEKDVIPAFLNIIKRLTEGNNTFIISHNSDVVDLIDNVIEFKKIKGFSRVLE